MTDYTSASTESADGFDNKESIALTSGLSWAPANPPDASELKWICSFGNHPGLAAAPGRISRRLHLEPANLKAATRIIVYHHYLHRGRTMAQMPYWITLDSVRVGVLLFSYPRVSVPLYGIPPMNVLELARMWIHPSVQADTCASVGNSNHAPSLASCALGKALRRCRRDWHTKYPHLPIIYAVIAWADESRHQGTIYKAANFKLMGRSGGKLHGTSRRPTGGNDQPRPDYAHQKAAFMYRWARN